MKRVFRTLLFLSASIPRQTGNGSIPFLALTGGSKITVEPSLSLFADCLVFASKESPANDLPGRTRRNYL